MSDWVHLGPGGGLGQARRGGEPRIGGSPGPADRREVTVRSNDARREDHPGGYNGRGGGPVDEGYGRGGCGGDDEFSAYGEGARRKGGGDGRGGERDPSQYRHHHDDRDPSYGRSDGRRGPSSKFVSGPPASSKYVSGPPARDRDAARPRERDRDAPIPKKKVRYGGYGYDGNNGGEGGGGFDNNGGGGRNDGSRQRDAAPDPMWAGRDAAPRDGRGSWGRQDNDRRNNDRRSQDSSASGWGQRQSSSRAANGDAGSQHGRIPPSNNDNVWQQQEGGAVRDGGGRQQQRPAQQESPFGGPRVPGQPQQQRPAQQQQQSPFGDWDDARRRHEAQNDAARGVGGSNGASAGTSASTATAATKEGENDLAMADASAAPPDPGTGDGGGTECDNMTAGDVDAAAAVEKKDVDADLSPTDAFMALNWKEKLLSQYRFEPAIDLPEEAFCEDSEKWRARKHESAERAIKAVTDRMHREALDKVKQAQDEESDESEWENDYVIGGGNTDPVYYYQYSVKQVKKFYRALPWCLLSTVGFNVTGLQPSHEENCHCPCGADMVKWRTQFGLEGSVAGKDHSKEYCTKGKMTPIGLMGHLRTEGDMHGCILHFGIKVYIEHLYGKTDGSYRAKMGHKAMYCINDSNWRKAEAAANRAKQADLKRVEQLLAEEKLRTQRLEEERSKDREKMEFVNRTNKDLAEQIKQLNEDKAALHIETRAKEETVVSAEMIKMREEMLKMSRKHMDMFFGMGAVASSWASGKEDHMEIKVGQNFSLQKFLDKTYRRYEKLQKMKSAKERVPMDATLLFSDLKGAKGLKNYYGKKILSDWNVVFENEAKYGRTMANREQKDLDTAVDEGGPSREFLSQFFYQIGDTKVDGVKIFENAKNGCVPQTFDWLNNKLGSSQELMDKAQAYYRAFGRVMLHAIATGNTISSSAMPVFYLNWIFRGCSPEDDDYHNEDVIDHLHEGNPAFKISTYLGVAIEYEVEKNVFIDIVVDEKTIFTHYLPQALLKSRKLAFDSITEGLTLDGDVRVQDYFRAMPLQAVQKLVFSLPSVSADAINGILRPKYCIGWEGSEEERREMRQQQENLFNSLREILLLKEETEPSYLAKFVAFCTGFNYLPDPEGNPDFLIDIEFNFAETVPGEHPKSHSCVKLLKLPGHCYSNRDDFEQKLDEAVLGSYGRFDMQ